MRMRRRGCEMRLVIGGANAANAHYDSTLVKSIARAHVWFQEMLCGKATSLLDLAKQHNVSESYVKKIMPFAFLGPSIVSEILTGKLAQYKSKQWLIRKAIIPTRWEDQRAFFLM